MKYRKKPTLTEATQWFKNGDHPQDNSKPVEKAGGSPGLTEGKVVRYFRRLNIPGGRFCEHCGNVMQHHGLLDGLNGEEVICPGDYIVTNRKGDYYKLSSTEFEEQYEPYEVIAHPAPKPSIPAKSET
jgi:hypothetical protein